MFHWKTESVKQFHTLKVELESRELAWVWSSWRIDHDYIVGNLNSGGKVNLELLHCDNN